MSKELIRKETKKKIKSLDKKERSKKSSVIQEKLFILDLFKKANTVMFYFSTEDEVDTERMISEACGMGKRVALPKIVGDKIQPSLYKEGDKLKKGPYGIYEPDDKTSRPISEREIDLIVVPGVAFDKRGNRLGRGKGYYDRFLKTAPSTAYTVGIAFDFQVVDNLPTDSQDIPVRKLITG
jgi:5-formyltetrahydrofolate cyclo-ligase